MKILVVGDSPSIPQATMLEQKYGDGTPTFVLCQPNDGITLDRLARMHGTRTIVMPPRKNANPPGGPVLLQATFDYAQIIYFDLRGRDPVIQEYQRPPA